jgi:hypothetical protein
MPVPWWCCPSISAPGCGPAARKNELYQATRDREAWQWLELSNPLRYGLAMLSPAATTGAAMRACA